VLGGADKVPVGCVVFFGIEKGKREEEEG